MSDVVYVRWYKDVVEGHVVNENDMFGMVAVSIPIQGVQATALFKPQHVYKTALEASHEYPITSYSEPAVQHPDVAPSVSEFMDSVIKSQNNINENIKNHETLDDWMAILEFKERHWDHEKNMLKLEYWQEFDRMYHNYQRKRRNMMYTKEQPEHFIKMDYPISEDEAFQKRIIPSTDNADVTAFVNKWAQPKKDEVVPRTLRKTVKLTELALWD